MRLSILVLLAFLVSKSVAVEDSCSKDVTPLLSTLFSSLGHDCSTYRSLYAEEAKYFHQHDGYKDASQLQGNCKSYAAFCPGNRCRFLQDGSALKISRENKCHILVPYLWSQMPAKTDNLEPHAGWEYIIAIPNAKSRFSYSIKYFAEVESSYSVAFNWAAPDQTPAVVADSTLRLLKGTASKGECSNPLATTLTKFFSDKSHVGTTYRQQGDAVVLASGGICQVVVPYSAQFGEELKTGKIFLTLQPGKNNGYSISDAVEFSRP